MYVFVGQILEVSPFRDVLADKFVGVLDGPFLPGGVAVRKVYGCVQCRGYPPMPVELHAVVRSYREDILPVQPQQSCNSLGHCIWILALRKPLHDKVVPAPFAQGQNLALLAFPKYQVHLPVSKPLPVRSWMLTLFGMFVVLVGRLCFLWRLYFILWRQWYRSSPLSSSRIISYILSWDTCIPRCFGHPDI